jgi:tRNA 2-thiouridine synthesizing protein E
MNVDKEGFLINLQDWNPEVADRMAAVDKMTLTPDHWEVITLVRDYYEEYRLFPANRILVTRMRDMFGQDKGSSIHLMKLFSGKPARVIAKIAGLPKPPNCD